jgi:L-histidine N-alpha-methyltransferase
VHIADLGIEVHFAEGEDLHTEISAKFTRAGVHEELHQAGFVVDAMWEDPAGDFLLTLARPYC